MAGCQVLYFDPAQVGRAIWGPPGRRDQIIGHHDGWKPCPADGHAWTDPDQVLRHVCGSHQRQLVALHAAGLAGRVRWTPTGRPA
jgi:hypothetical protein